MLPSYQSSVYVSLCSPCCLTLSHLSAHVVLAQIGYLVKSLDQGNINNAFLSGMKEDLFVSHSLSVFIQRLSRLLHQRNVWKSTCTCRNLLCMSRRLWLPAFPSSAPPPPLKRQNLFNLPRKECRLHHRTASLNSTPHSSPCALGHSWHRTICRHFYFGSLRHKDCRESFLTSFWRQTLL